MSWLKEQFLLLGKFLRTDFRKTVLWCAVGMVLAGLLGFGFSLFRPNAAMSVIQNFMDQIAQSGVIDEEGQMSVFALLMNNWRAMLISALYGLVPFLFLPMVSLLTNGLLVGVMFGIYQARGLSLLTLLAGLVPHGIFEIPALVFSIACGVKLCKNMCLLVTSSPQKVPFLTLAEDLLRVLVLVIAPLTMVAAFMECYVTPIVMSWSMQGHI